MLSNYNEFHKGQCLLSPLKSCYYHLSPDITGENYYKKWMPVLAAKMKPFMTSGEFVLQLCHNFSCT